MQNNKKSKRRIGVSEHTYQQIRKLAYEMNLHGCQVVEVILNEWFASPKPLTLLPTQNHEDQAAEKPAASPQESTEEEPWTPSALDLLEAAES